MALGLTKSSGLLRHRSPKRLAADKASGARSKASGKVCSMAEDEARELFERYKKSKLGVVAFSLSNGFYSEGLSRAFRKHFPDEYEDAKEAKAIKRDCWYRVGRRYEYEVGNLMRGDGWVVMRSPGSKSPADLIAIRDGCVALVQCKRGASTLSKKEKKALVAMATKAGGLPILACKVGRAGDTRFRLCTSDGYSPWDAH